MIWRILRRITKNLIAFAVIIAALAIFVVWKAQRAAREAAARIRPALIEDTRAKEALVASKAERLLLVDNDLYDVDTGAALFKNWLKEGMPVKLFWEPDSKTMLAQYERGFVRYKLDGTEQATLAQKYPFGISDDYRWIVFARDKDVWRADVDWKGLKLADERKVTSIGQFNDQNFAGNIMLGTQKTLVVRNMNQILRINLENGDVHPTKLPLLEIGKRRSPDSMSVVGFINGQFYCYNVDSDDAKLKPMGKRAVTDYQWLTNDRCVAVAGMKTVIQYDRVTDALTDVVALPLPCTRIAEPSPDGRFVFCLGNITGKGVLVDLEKKTATPVTGGAGVWWVSNDTFAFSRDVADSSLRGTWLHTSGEEERRVSPEPYLVSQTRPLLVSIKPTGLDIFATKYGLSKMKPDGTGLAEFVNLSKPPLRMLGIEEWKAQ